MKRREIPLSSEIAPPQPTIEHYEYWRESGRQECFQGVMALQCVGWNALLFLWYCRIEDFLSKFAFNGPTHPLSKREEKWFHNPGLNFFFPLNLLPPILEWNQPFGWFQLFLLSWTSLVAQTVKRLPTRLGTRVWSPCLEDPMEKEMATHSSTLAWKIPWTEEPGRLQSMGSQRVRHGWATSLCHKRNL